MLRTKRAGAALGVTLALGMGLLPGTAWAHPGDKDGGSAGHLPGKQENVRLVGEATVTPRPSTKPLPDGTTSRLAGRIADVSVFGNFAYLAAFREPTCDNGGVFVMDMTDPTKPVEVQDAFIPSAAGTYVGEGVQVLQVGARDVLLFNQEPCDSTDPAAQGGFSLIDVTNPRRPVPLKMSAGDNTTEGTATPTATVNSSHSVFGWNDGAKSYAVAVDNVEEKDIDIFDISNPSAPVPVSETSFVDDPRVVQANPPNGDSQFFHDVQVKEINGRQTMLASYWDNGYIILDVEDPANPQFLRDTDFAATEPFATQLGLPAGFEPEGNAHQAEFSPNNEFFIGTDEDFNPFRVTAKITSGVNAGRQFTASQGSSQPNVDQNRSVTGQTVYGGFGCIANSVPPGGATQTVLIERGAAAGQTACTFQAKYDNAVAAGYGAVLVFNNKRADCQSLVNPAVTEKGTVPFVFINRGDGLSILNQAVSADACTQESPPIGTRGGDIDIRAVFDGWGYVHLYDAKTMEPIDEYAIPESLDVSKAEGFGDLSVHEVAMDPKVPGRAYLSYYGGGFRVISFDRSGIKEIGAYISGNGSNLWGVEFWTSPTTGQDYVLASDRDFGLQIFQYAPGSSSACAVPATVQLQTDTIIATGSSGVTVTAPASATVDLLAYTRPSSTYRVVRSGVVGSTGKITFPALRPPANTRLYAQVRGCTANIARDSKVLNVRTALSLFATRNGPRNYTFTGDSLPARPGGLIVSLYRVTADGRQVLTSQTRASATTGDWTINRRFTGEGRFGFVVRTGQDLQNAPGTSNVRPTLIF